MTRSRQPLNQLDLGGLGLRSLGETVRVEGQTAAAVESDGTAQLFEVRGSDDLRLTVRDTRWRNGERDIVACERHESPPRFDTLVERLRLSVLDYGGPYVELRQARLRPNGRAGLFDALFDDLTEGAGIDVRAVLLRNGARAVGSREELLGDTGRTRRRFGARFEDGEALVPVIAYALTRIAPVARGLAA